MSDPMSMFTPHPFQTRQAVRVLHAGGVIAYPTEAVYGLGCDPMDAAAVLRILELKKRPWQKGLILIASDRQQLDPFILPLSQELQTLLDESWPGPITWLLPAHPEVPYWLRGEHNSIAVRVTAHAGTRVLCEAFGRAIVSTSANPATLPPARSPLKVRRYFGDGLGMILHGPLGGRAQPSEIRDASSGRVIRAA